MAFDQDPFGITKSETHEAASPLLLTDDQISVVYGGNADDTPAPPPEPTPTLVPLPTW